MVIKGKRKALSDTQEQADAISAAHNGRLPKFTSLSAWRSRRYLGDDGKYYIRPPRRRHRRQIK